MKKKSISVEPQVERAILVAVALGGKLEEAEESLRELERLADTAGAQAVGTILQRREKIDPRSYVGRGKLEEIHAEIQATDANLILFDNDLTPGQARTIEEDTKTRVLDRSELILDIFARCARTHQAKVQVELAQLEYLYPRLRRMWTHLEKTGGRIGTRGPGETQLETDRRIIRTRIEKLKAQLREIEKRKEREVDTRSSMFTVSLVGYTNAGKTTLLNRLTGSQEIVRDQLFTTLDTRTRNWNLPAGRKLLLSDTVGFLRNLPHHLVASFYTTLEEARHADLLLHVLDCSHPMADLHIEAVENVLKEIGAGDRPRLFVFNKVDAVQDFMELEALRRRVGNSVLVSARTGKGIDELGKRVLEFYEKQLIRVLVRTPAGNGRAIHQLYQHGTVLEGRFENDQFIATVECTPQAYGSLQGALSGDSTSLQVLESVS